MVSKRKWQVLSITFIIILAAAIHLSTLPPLYQSSATLLIEVNKSKVVSIEDLYSSDYSSQSYIQTQLELMKSRHLVEEVTRQERLDLAPEFNPNKQRKRRGWMQDNWVPKWMQVYLRPVNKAPLEVVQKDGPDVAIKNEAGKSDFNSHQFASLINMVSSRINVAPVHNSQLVRVTFTSESPKLAARVATAIAQTYINQTLEARLQMTKHAVSWLTERLEGLRQGLDESEKKLQKYRDSSGMLSSSERDSMEVQQLSSLNALWLEAKAKRVEAQVRYERLQSLMSEYKDRLNELPLADNPVVDGLHGKASKISLQLSKLSGRYGKKHPKIIRTSKELEEVKKKISQEIKRAITTIRHKFKVAELQETKARQQLQTQKELLQEHQKKVFVINNLERDVQANRQLYDLFQKRFKEAGVTEGMEPVNARIVDPANPPARSFTPNKPRSLALATLLGLMLGAFLAISLEYMDRTVKQPGDLEINVGIPIFAILPKLSVLRSKIFNPEGMMIIYPRSSYSEAMRTIRTNVILTSRDDPPKIILITSSVPGEGKTTVAINLAHAFLMSGERVLLIEADLRKPRMNKYFKFDLTGNINNLMLESNETTDSLNSDFTSGFSGNSLVDQFSIIRKEITVSTEGLHLLLCQQSMMFPSEALASETWVQTLSILRQHYDRIFVDSPPVLAVSDALVIGSQADAALFVIKASQTQRRLIVEATKQLSRVNARVLGLILNNLDTKKTPHHGGGYSYGNGYGNSYGDSHGGKA